MSFVSSQRLNRRQVIFRTVFSALTAALPGKLVLAKSQSEPTQELAEAKISILAPTYADNADTVHCHVEIAGSEKPGVYLQRLELSLESHISIPVARVSFTQKLKRHTFGTRFRIPFAPQHDSNIVAKATFSDESEIRTKHKVVAPCSIAPICMEND